MKITSYTFRVRVRDPVDDEHAERLYEAFDEEIAIESGPRGHYVGFDRDAPSFVDAAVDAIDVLITLGFEPIAVEDELVSMADIAERTGRSRQSVSLLASGRRGPGSFPPPAAGNVRSPLWHWDEVATWFQTTAPEGTIGEDRPAAIAAINGALANRRLARDHPDYLSRIGRLAG
ncbi:MAG: helix-turn-helix transcriptional regulator [Acidimicrobiales bacterium]|jgi:hypothetical protein|nr:hypothetical protein [Actinomycetota bacterium]